MQLTAPAERFTWPNKLVYVLMGASRLVATRDGRHDANKTTPARP